MGMLGSFLGGAAVGIAALGALAGFYCNFYNPSGNITDSFSFLEKQDDDDTNASTETANV